MWTLPINFSFRHRPKKSTTLIFFSCHTINVPSLMLFTKICLKLDLNDSLKYQKMNKLSIVQVASEQFKWNILSVLPNKQRQQLQGRSWQWGTRATKKNVLHVLSQMTRKEHHPLLNKPLTCHHEYLSLRSQGLAFSFRNWRSNKDTSLNDCPAFCLCTLPTIPCAIYKQRWRKAGRMLTDRVRREVLSATRLTNKAGCRKEVVFINAGITVGVA